MSRENIFSNERERSLRVASIEQIAVQVCRCYELDFKTFPDMKSSKVKREIRMIISNLAHKRMFNNHNVSRFFRMKLTAVAMLKRTYFYKNLKSSKKSCGLNTFRQMYVICHNAVINFEKTL